MFFLQHPSMMWWINRIYSWVHLPATISFLVGLYYFTITRNRSSALSSWHVDRVNGPDLYESRRRALALCNLFAFCVFSTWPCMPPRLLGDSKLSGEAGELARSFQFVDTVHARNGAVSVFNTRKFTNQLGKEGSYISDPLKNGADRNIAAMPSLHFGYSLLIGVSLMTLPLSHPSRYYRLTWAPTRLFGSNAGFYIRVPSFPKFLCEFVGVVYPATILVAIIATANHFITDAIAGGMICFFALRCNQLMMNLLPLEDCLFWCLRIHKPVQYVPVQQEEWGDKF